MQVLHEVKECEFGLGLFSKQYINKGDVVWKASVGENVLLFSEQDFNDFHLTSTPEEYERLLEIAYSDSSLIKNGIVIPKDECQYTNHSNTPNCGSYNCHHHVNASGHNDNDPKFWAHSYALRDIDINEELTEDYTHYHIPNWFIKVLTNENKLPNYYDVCM
jgi:hypothetical protein